MSKSNPPSFTREQVEKINEEARATLQRYRELKARWKELNERSGLTPERVKSILARARPADRRAVERGTAILLQRIHEKVHSEPTAVRPHKKPRAMV